MESNGEQTTTGCRCTCNSMKNKYMFEFTLQYFKHFEWTNQWNYALRHFYSTFKQISNFTVNYVDHFWILAIFNYPGVFSHIILYAGLKYHGSAMSPGPDGRTRFPVESFFFFFLEFLFSGLVKLDACSSSRMSVSHVCWWKNSSKVTWLRGCMSKAVHL